MLRSFLFGALCYPALEMCWRGRTHWSMAIAGGLSSALIFRVSRFRGRNACKALFCTAGITIIEYTAGKAVNRRFKVWDYRRLPLNLQGQVCVPYMVLWYGMSLCMLHVIDNCKRITDDQDRP